MPIWKVKPLPRVGQKWVGPELSVLLARIFFLYLRVSALLTRSSFVLRSLAKCWAYKAEDTGLNPVASNLVVHWGPVQWSPRIAWRKLTQKWFESAVYENVMQ